MTKKLLSKKDVKPVEHEEVDTHVIVEKRESGGTKKVLKEKGTEHDNDNNPTGALPEGKAVVGLSKGLTINLQNYESARVNCWISKVSNDDEVSIMNTLAEISELIDEQIQFEVDEISEMKN